MLSTLFSMEDSDPVGYHSVDALLGPLPSSLRSFFILSSIDSHSSYPALYGLCIVVCFLWLSKGVPYFPQTPNNIRIRFTIYNRGHLFNVLTVCPQVCVFEKYVNSVLVIDIFHETVHKNLKFSLAVGYIILVQLV